MSPSINIVLIAKKRRHLKQSVSNKIPLIFQQWFVNGILFYRRQYESVLRKSLNIPETPEYDYISEGEERDLSYVIDQCERLALQLEIQMYKVVEHTVL